MSKNRYVPPARRNPESAVLDKLKYSVDDINAHYWPHTPPPLSEDRQSTTLNASEADPYSLRYLLLFRGANRRWTSDRIIFAKTNLEVLPEVEHDIPTPSQKPSIMDAPIPSSDDTASITSSSKEAWKSPSVSENAKKAAKPPVPLTGPLTVFEEEYSPTTRGEFHFIGYFRLIRQDRLAPGSPEVVRMLEQKWSTPPRRSGQVAMVKPRNPEAWQKSLGHEWAVLKFERDEEAEEDLGAPGVQVIGGFGDAGGEGRGKSVNELLDEMKLGSESGGVAL
ncbi:hypothetical protein K402DRAFT_392469 [Aulographum hederae CBS 113979]|uniref:Uncharacterized protein n=1 Tax=Aulographum hederae CBS 113979 TaxID=1176131 RepID=A0A6G1H3W7_9PEZI|nr:hypothetical protein K402DRAFT_392469 [Aulographum hederae CBS 113979]